MKDIITIGKVNFAPVNSKTEEQRILGYIRALKKRGVELIVFPLLSAVQTEQLREAAVKYKTAIVWGMADNGVFFCLDDGSIIQTNGGWRIIDTKWGIFGLTNDQMKYKKEKPKGVRFILEPYQTEDKDGGFYASIETLDLSESELEGSYE